MPLSKDSEKTLSHFKDEYGDKLGETYFYKWVNQEGIDDQKSLKDQEAKMHATACPHCDMVKAFLTKDGREGKEPDSKMASPQTAGNMVTDMMPDNKASGPDPDVVPTTKTEKNEKEVDFHDKFLEAHHEDKPAPKGIPYEPHPEASGPDKDVVPTQKTPKNEKEKESDLVSPREPYERTPNPSKEFYNSASFKMPTLHYAMQFKADAQGALSTGEIRGTGILVSQTDIENKNGWRIGKMGKEKEEFESISNQLNGAYSANKAVQVRLQHSDQPDKIIGGFYAGEADIREGYYGLNTTFFMNPKDPQVRYNIERGLLRDMSIGLDANAFCAACDKPLRQNAEGGSQMWDYDCPHLGSPVYLTGCRIREGSIVSEPAFEGSTFKIGFAAALEKALPSRSLNTNSPIIASSDIMSAQVQVEAAKAKSEGANNPFEGMDERDQLLIKSKAFKAWKAKMFAALDDKEEDEHMEGKAEASKVKAYSDPNMGDATPNSNEVPRKDLPPDTKIVISAKGEAEEDKAEGEASAKAKASPTKQIIQSKLQSVAPAKVASSNSWNACADEMTKELMLIAKRQKPSYRG